MITKNVAGYGGGGVMCYLYECDAVITNCTISENDAVEGAGLWCDYDSSPVVTNCIIWGDLAGEIYSFFSFPMVTYCDVEGGYSGIGNIDADPLFVDPANDDFHLTYQSPCKNTGHPSAVTEPCDFEGDPRGGTAAMGADEFWFHLYHTGDVDDVYECGEIGSRIVRAFTSIEGFVFTRNGKKIKDIRESFQGACKRAGVKNFRFHDFRHTAITNMSRAGISAKVRMAITGHKTYEVHLRYQSVEENDLEDARKIMNENMDTKWIPEAIEEESTELTSNVTNCNNRKI